jgi:hypothetical protein
MAGVQRRFWGGLLGAAISASGTPAQSPAPTVVPIPAFADNASGVAAATVLAPAPIPEPNPAPAPDPQSTGPGSHGWPGTASPRPTWSPLDAYPPPPPPPLPPVLETPPSAFTGYNVPPPVIVPDAEGLPPLPGSLEENFNRELGARRLFRVCTWNDYRITGFPQTLLWQPPIAEKRAPRFQALGTTLDNYANSRTLDSSIGNTLGLLRVDTPGRDLSFQLDAFAVVHTRHTPANILVQDYRYGIPLTWRRGLWSGKLSYEHTSSHVGDDALFAGAVTPIRYSKDEAVLGVARDFDSLRVYGQVSYAFKQNLIDRPKKYRFDAGFQWVCPFATGFSGAPYIAANVTSRGELKYNPDGLAQVGWMWRNPYQRLANLRVFVEYYQGHSPFGQLIYQREKWTGVGIAADF